MPQAEGFKERLARIDGLVGKLETSQDPAHRAATKELMQSIMELHGAGMERMLEITSEAADGGASIIDRFGADPLVGSLLVLHGLHPSDLATRVNQALDKVGPMLKSRGATLELLNLDADKVHLRIRAEGCASTSDNLRSAVQDAIYEAAPDVGHLLMEPEAVPAGSSGFVPLQSLGGLQPLRES
jgi:Fe-S cluster biogenesis protein NfuA